jgi:hypothetical protein
MYAADRGATRRNIFAVGNPVLGVHAVPRDERDVVGESYPSQLSERVQQHVGARELCERDDVGVGELVRG